MKMSSDLDRMIISNRCDDPKEKSIIQDVNAKIQTNEIVIGMMYKTDGYSYRNKALAKERVLSLKEKNREELRERKEKVKEFSKQTNALKKIRENRIKSKEQQEDERRQKILKARKLQQQLATEKFQRNAETQLQVKKEIDKRQGSRAGSGLSDGQYSVRGHIIEIKDGVRINSARKPKLEQDEQNDDIYDTPQLTMSPIFQNSVYAPNSYLSNHLTKLLADSKTPDNNEDNEPANPLDKTMMELNKPAANDDWNEYYMRKELVAKSSNQENLHQNTSSNQENQYQNQYNSGQQIRDRLIVDQTSAMNEEPSLIAVEQEKTISPCGSHSSLDSLNDSASHLRSNLKRISSRSISDKKVTFSSSIEFNDGKTEMMKTSMTKRVPLYKRIQNNNNLEQDENNNDDDSSKMTTEDLLDQLRQEILLPQFPANDDYNYPESVSFTSQNNQNNVAIVAPIMSTATTTIITPTIDGSSDAAKRFCGTTPRIAESADAMKRSYQSNSSSISHGDIEEDSLQTKSSTSLFIDSIDGSKQDVLISDDENINNDSLDVDEKIRQKNNEINELTQFSTSNSSAIVNPVYFSYGDSQAQTNTSPIYSTPQAPLNTTYPPSTNKSWVDNVNTEINANLETQGRYNHEYINQPTCSQSQQDLHSNPINISSQQPRFHHPSNMQSTQNQPTYSQSQQNSYGNCANISEHNQRFQQPSNYIQNQISMQQNSVSAASASQFQSNPVGSMSNQHHVIRNTPQSLPAHLTAPTTTRVSSLNEQINYITTRPLTTQYNSQMTTENYPTNSTVSSSQMNQRATNRNYSTQQTSQQYVVNNTYTTPTTTVNNDFLSRNEQQLYSSFVPPADRYLQQQSHQYSHDQSTPSSYYQPVNTQPVITSLSHFNSSNNTVLQTTTTPVTSYSHTQRENLNSTLSSTQQSSVSYPQGNVNSTLPSTYSSDNNRKNIPSQYKSNYDNKNIPATSEKQQRSVGSYPSSMHSNSYQPITQSSYSNYERTNFNGIRPETANRSDKDQPSRSISRQYSHDSRKSSPSTLNQRNMMRQLSKDISKSNVPNQQNVTRQLSKDMPKRNSSISNVEVNENKTTPLSKSQQNADRKSGKENNDGSNKNVINRSISSSSSDEIYKEVEKSLAGLTFENQRVHVDSQMFNHQGFSQKEQNYERPRNQPHGDLFDQTNNEMNDDGRNENQTKDRISEAVRKGSAIPIRVHPNNFRRGRVIVSADRKHRTPANGLTPHPPPQQKKSIQSETSITKTESKATDIDTPRKSSSRDRTIIILREKSHENKPKVHHKRASSANAILNRRPPVPTKQRPQSHIIHNHQRPCSRGGLPDYRPKQFDNKRQQNGPIKAIPLDKTPTDDEINRLWENVRECLSHDSTTMTEQLYSEPRIQPSPQPYSYHQRTLSGSSLNRRSIQQRVPYYRQNSSDSMSSSSSSRKQALLPHRANRMIQQSTLGNTAVEQAIPKHLQAYNGTIRKSNHVMSKYQEKDVTASMASFLALEDLCSKQSLTPRQTEAVFQASKQMIRKQENAQHKQGLSALSIEEKCVMESLNRLNQKLLEQEKSGLYTRPTSSKYRDY